MHGFHFRLYLSTDTKRFFELQTSTGMLKIMNFRVC